jgi:RNA polymerase sigma-70 factor, ECF subfamily
MAVHLCVDAQEVVGADVERMAQADEGPNVDVCADSALDRMQRGVSDPGSRGQLLPGPSNVLAASSHSFGQGHRLSLRAPTIARVIRFGVPDFRRLTVLCSYIIVSTAHTSMPTRDEIVSHFADLIPPIARSVCRSVTAQIDDLEQEGMLALLAAAEKWDPARAETFGAYVKIRVRGAMIDYLRGADGTQELVEETTPATNVVSIDTAVSRRETGEHAVKNLTDRQQQVIEFRYRQGLTQVETGRRLGISQEAVRRLEGRAVVSMKKHLSIAA